MFPYEIEKPIIRKFNIQQPIIDGHNYKIGVTQTQYQVNGQQNITDTQQVGVGSGTPE